MQPLWPSSPEKPKLGVYFKGVMLREENFEVTPRQWSRALGRGLCKIAAGQQWSWQNLQGKLHDWRSFGLTKAG